MNALEETIIHLKTKWNTESKFMPGEKPESKKAISDFYNRVILGDNTDHGSMTDQVKTAFFKL